MYFGAHIAINIDRVVGDHYAPCQNRLSEGLGKAFDHSYGVCISDGSESPCPKTGVSGFESGLVKWDLGRLKQVFVNTDLWKSESFFWLYPVN